MSSLKLLLPIVIISSSIPAFSQSLCFDPASDNRYSTGMGPNSVASADYNNDGNLDIITANAYEGSISFLTGNGDGTFDESIFIYPGNVNQVIAADVDQDNNADIVAHESGTGGVTVILGNGDGTFGTAVTDIMPVVDGGYEQQIEVNDLNGDGYPDILVNSSADNDLYILLNDGNGNYVSALIFPMSAATQYMDTGDLNGDGAPDIVLSYYESNDNVSILYNNGNGTFGSLTSIYAGVPIPGLMTVQIVNLDGDSDKDIAVGGMTSMYILRNNGNGTFTSLANAFIGSYTYDLTAGDWDEDGDNDLLWPTDSGGSVGVILNNGDGTFPINGNKFYSTHGQAISVTKGDFNEDGNIDVVTANRQNNTVSFTAGNGDGTFGDMSLITGYGASGFAVADFDNNSSPDIVAVNYFFSEMSINLNNGDGTFANSVFSPAPGAADDIVAGDFNEDGNIDVVVYGSDGYGILEGNGNGTFDAATNYPGGSLGGGTRTLAAGDFNNDGNLDVAGTFASVDELNIALGNGNGTFDAAITIIVPEYPRQIAVGDLDNDNDDDIVVSGNVSNDISIILSNGDGTFQSPFVISTSGDPDGLAIFDANNDFYADIAVARSNDNVLSLYPGNGNGTFDSPIETSVPSNSNLTKITSADFNSDGNEDIVGSFYQMDSGGILFGNGDGTFEPALLYEADQQPEGITTADFNMDGAVDIAVLNTGTNNISVILNNSAYITALGPLAMCEGETTTLEASDGYSYLWSNGATTQTIVVDEGDEYFVEITNQAGTCTLLTPSITIEVFPVIPVTLNLTVDETCISQDPFSFFGGSPFGGTYSGNGVDENFNQFDPAVAGPGSHIITYTYSDIAECSNGSATDTIVVVASPEVTLDPLANDTICSDSDPIVLTGGNPAGGVYTIFDVPYTVFDPDVAGPGYYEIVYTYTVAENCSGSDSQILVVELCDNLHSLNASGMHFLQLPDQLLLTLDEGYDFRIFNSAGKLITSKFFEEGSHSIDKKSMSPGIYIITLTNNSGVTSVPLLVH